jgi:hypothetical protein
VKVTSYQSAEINTRLLHGRRQTNTSAAVNVKTGVPSPV